MTALGERAIHYTHGCFLSMIIISSRRPYLFLPCLCTWLFAAACSAAYSCFLFCDEGICLSLSSVCLSVYLSVCLYYSLFRSSNLLSINNHEDAACLYLCLAVTDHLCLFLVFDRYFQQIFRAIVPARGELKESRTAAEAKKCGRLKKDKVGLSVLFTRWSFVTKVCLHSGGGEVTSLHV